MATDNKKGLYYLKDKKARVYKPYSYVNANGYHSSKYYIPTTPKDIWCYSNQLSQARIFMAQAFLTDEERIFVFNYYDNIDVGDYIRYSGKWYQITRVKTNDDYKGELHVYVKYCKGSYPKDSELLEYGQEPPTA